MANNKLLKKQIMRTAMVLISLAIASCIIWFVLGRNQGAEDFYTLKKITSGTVWKPVPRNMASPGYICGALGSHIIEISKKYLFVWPEYQSESTEGSSEHSPVKGCHEKLAALPMAMTWPGLQPHLGGFYPAPSDIENGLRMTVRSDSTGSLLLFNTVLDYLGDDALSKMEKGRIVSPGLKKAAGTTHDGGLVMVYWTDFNMPRPTIFICRWGIEGYQFFLCEGRFVIEPKGVQVEVVISPEKMVDWSRIIEASDQLIRSKLKPVR